VRAKSAVYVHAKNNTKHHCDAQKGRVNKTKRRKMQATLYICLNYCTNHKRITREANGSLKIMFIYMIIKENFLKTAAGLTNTK